MAITFFDTSALVPLFTPQHVHATETQAAFRNLRHDERACGMHSLAEAFHAITRSASHATATPRQAQEFVAFLRSSMTVVKPSTDDYLAAVACLAGLNRGGALMYDALLLQAARKVQAETIYTWNVKHFRLLAPDLADRIRTP